MESKDALLKVRLPSELKADLRAVAESDPKTGDLSKFCRYHLRVAMKVAKKQQEDDT